MGDDLMIAINLGLLGAYDDEEAAARAYDLAALKYWGQDTILNFPLSNYEEKLKEMEGQSKEEYIGSLRRKSSGFSRGVSKYRGVARHHHNGRWEARIGRVFGNKYLYLGTYATQEEAAAAYDMAAIEYRGLNAVTNFDLSRYINWPRPKTEENHQTIPSNENVNSNAELELGSASDEITEEGVAPSSESNPSRRTFPEDIQTIFENQDSGIYTENDDIIFGDLGSFGAPIFHYELDV
ncbi:AP2-like ethylene-responsive transcription factor [Glycine soja]|uniref:AP2-like ethylene-responsive transcription factor isoform C n=1 Tax=Glycine soja TaxID=3848 RepID=A0A445JR19_GLYSO|nr:AP2-like ethylene-responsive transcription factor isoform C [Glycine soja]